MSKDDSSPLTRDIAPFGVRMPPDLKERVADAAKANNRSMNAEIVATLEEKYPAPKVYDFELAVQSVLDLLAKKDVLISRDPGHREQVRQILLQAMEAYPSPLPKPKPTSLVAPLPPSQAT